MKPIFSIAPDTSLPVLFARFPQTRAIFNQYGLRGCGGQNGPQESIQFFAQAHGVTLSILLDQIRNVVSNPAKTQQAYEQLQQETARPRFIDAIYRPYFLAAIASMLTAGAAWGVLLLLKIGAISSFTGVSILEVNAHGHAQVMGWVGLFIIGFSYQAFPRMWHCQVVGPRLAPLVLGALICGIVLRVMAMYAHDQPWAITLHRTGAVLETAAVVTFAVQMLWTFLHSLQPVAPYLVLIFAAIFFLVLQTVFSSWHMDRLLRAVTREQLLAQISGWQSPLRDMQIHGLALLMIMGVGMRMFPAIFGFAEISSRRAWTGLSLLLGAVFLEIIFFATMTLTQVHAVGVLLLLPWLMLPAGVGIIVWPWKVWRPSPVSERSAKFIHAAFMWLFISLGMLLLLPGYIYLSGQGFSHAYYGSARHAITVGFISLMIVGMSSKVVPTLRGVFPAQLPALWLPFVLINLGCLLRVSFQVGTDWHPLFFKLVGISGCCEWAGFALWGWHMTAVMLGLGRYAPITSQPDSHYSQSPNALILPSHYVAQVLTWYPTLETVFIDNGFDLITRPSLRKTIARQTTLQQACLMKNVTVDAFISQLNNARQLHTHPTSAPSDQHITLTVCGADINKTSPTSVQ